ncbi:uncharacterized protein LOC124341046 [Daphnia pulicaria]|uniref:uncharacterized protein LOC124341046 n=1 Tax=Daphnia pulicaria TaxID=35523 RepID=UPI001EEAF859|nr:uncharacterized protein LOC124341046 [Daphnia pulicaria]
MPQLIGVKSLFQTCLDFVVNNMALLCEEPTSDFANSNQSINSPFDQLPNKLLEEIIIALRDGGGLKQFLGLLALPHLETLDLRDLGPEDQFIELDNSMQRCVNLKHLFWELSNIDELFTSFIPKLSKLQVLDISCSDADDSSLEVIGTYCKDLRVLEFNACQNITDIGVKGLCDGATRNLGSGGDGLGLPKSLLKLGSILTSITHAGIQIILENFHSLQVWDHIPTVQNLTEIHKEVFLNQKLEIPKYSLICLTISRSASYIPKALGFVLSLCPSVIQVEINSYEGLTDSDLLDLLSLKNLRNFKMHGDYPSNGNVTFGGGVTPILKAFGNSSLKKLSLSMLSDVNILVITQLCPNLHSLVLHYGLSYSTAKLVKEWVKTEPEVLKQLEKLRVFGSGIPREHLILLLSSPLLVEITFVRCSTLDDDILQKVAGIQKFNNLERLCVRDCHNVTEKGIDIFMNAQNPLRSILIDGCVEITKSNVECWERQAKKNNWQLLIGYY